jgi:Adenylate and Guanylate cyclase catalytic domain
MRIRESFEHVKVHIRISDELRAAMQSNESLQCVKKGFDSTVKAKSTPLTLSATIDDSDFDAPVDPDADDKDGSECTKALESLYGRFDRIAHRLGVYKVETIGDCYVAVTGLPDPQPLHAVIMTQFALECLHEMQRFVRVGLEKIRSAFPCALGCIVAP